MFENLDEGKKNFKISKWNFFYTKNKLVISLAFRWAIVLALLTTLKTCS